jgi:hypothetical protein
MILIEFSNHVHTYLTLLYTIYVVVVVLLMKGRADTTVTLPVSFLVISLIVLVLLKLPSIFVNAPFNADEAQFLAAAIKLRSNMNTWLSVDLMTSGPLNAIPLMWPFLFGLDTGFAVAHMTAVALLGITWLFLLCALHFAPRDARIFLGGATILLLADAAHFDYLEFASELFPCFLLMFSAAVALTAAGKRTGLSGILAAGFCLGAVPFVKLQATPIALTIGLILLVLTFRRQPRPWRAGLLLAASACVPAALILTPLMMANGISDFWRSYVYGGLVYTQGTWDKAQHWGLVPPQIVALVRLLSADRVLKFYLILLSAISIAALGAICIGAGWRENAWSQRKILFSTDSQRCAISALILASGLLAAASPARPYEHYAYFVIWPAALFTGSVWSVARTSIRISSTAATRLSGALGVLLVGVTGALASVEYRYKMEENQIFSNPGSTFLPVALLPTGHGEQGRALVWGYMPELYVWSGWTPTTRDQISYLEIWPLPTRDYYRERTISDLLGSPPDYVIDAVGRGEAVFFDPKTQGISSFPELAQFVSENYTLVSRAATLASSTGLGSACPRIYASRDAAAELERTSVPPIGVSAVAGADSAEAARVAGGFVTCLDSLLVPSGASGKILLDLGGTKEIASVEIMNLPVWARFGSVPRAEKLTGAVRAFAGEAVTMDQGIAVPAYPQWIAVKPHDPIVADKIVVEAENFPHGLTLIRVRR